MTLLVSESLTAFSLHSMHGVSPVLMTWWCSYRNWCCSVECSAEKRKKKFFCGLVTTDGLIWNLFFRDLKKFIAIAKAQEQYFFVYVFKNRLCFFVITKPPKVSVVIIIALGSFQSFEIVISFGFIVKFYIANWQCRNLTLNFFPSPSNRSSRPVEMLFSQLSTKAKEW